MKYRSNHYWVKIGQLLVLTASVLCAGINYSQAQAQVQDNEYQVKALFLYNFANFVEWPADAFETTTSPITLCLFGSVPFGAFLQAVNGTLIGDRELTIYEGDTIDKIKDGCHILFVGEQKKVLLPTLWKEIKYIYVLSIGEKKGFADEGGIINIMRTTDSVQFEVNISNAISNGLFISSDLLSLAREIKRNTVDPDDTKP